MPSFIIKEDFEQVISLEDLDRITDSNDLVWERSMEANIEYVSCYLRHRYDTDKVFSKIYTHSSSVAWIEGDRVIDGGILFYALQDVPIGIPITDTVYWGVGDTRNKKIVLVVITLIMYDIYTRLNGVDIPSYIQVKYDDSISYLKDAGTKSLITIDLPLRASVEDGTDQSGNIFIHGYASDVVDLKFVP